MNGIALIVIVSQLPKLFGFSVDAEGVIEGTQEFVEGVADGETNVTAAGDRCLRAGRHPRDQAVLAPCARGARGRSSGRRCRRTVRPRRPPGRCRVVGVLPRGLPSFSVPDVGAADLGHLAVGAARASRWCRSPTPACCPARSPLRHGDTVDPNQEMICPRDRQRGQRVVPGVPRQQQFVPHAGGRAGRVAVAGDRIGGCRRDRVAARRRAGLVRNLPQSALAAVVIAAALGLFEVAGVRRLWRIRAASSRCPSPASSAWRSSG